MRCLNLFFECCNSDLTPRHNKYQNSFLTSSYLNFPIKLSPPLDKSVGSAFLKIFNLTTFQQRSSYFVKNWKSFFLHFFIICHLGMNKMCVISVRISEDIFYIIFIIILLLGVGSPACGNKIVGGGGFLSFSTSQ